VKMDTIDVKTLTLDELEYWLGVLMDELFRRVKEAPR